MARPITDTLRLLEGGTFLDKCSDEMTNLVKQVESTGKGGEIVIRVKVKRVTASTVGLIPTCETKIPKEKPDEMLFYPTPDGNLSIDNPKQQKLDLKPVETGKPSEFKQA